MSTNPGDVVIWHGMLWRVQRRYRLGEKIGLTDREEDIVLVDLQPLTPGWSFYAGAAERQCWLLPAQLRRLIGLPAATGWQREERRSR